MWMTFNHLKTNSTKLAHYSDLKFEKLLSFLLSVFGGGGGGGGEGRRSKVGGSIALGRGRTDEEEVENGR